MNKIKQYILKVVVLITLFTSVMSCMSADEIRERAKMLSPNEYVFLKADTNIQGKTGNITAEKVTALFQEDKLSIIDLRSFSEFSKENITGSVNVPYGENFLNDALKITNQKPIALIASQDSIAVKAMNQMQNLGFSTVYSFQNGLKVWKEAGNETQSLSIDSDKKNLSYADFNKAIAANVGQVVDVRTQLEYSFYHIPGAIVIDYKKANFADEFKKLDKNKAVLIYCRSGVRSANAIPTLEKLGFEVYNLGHGMLDWRKHHMPIQGEDVNAQDAGEEGC